MNGSDDNGVAPTQEAVVLYTDSQGNQMNEQGVPPIGGGVLASDFAGNDPVRGTGIANTQQFVLNTSPNVPGAIDPAHGVAIPANTLLLSATFGLPGNDILRSPDAGFIFDAWVLLHWTGDNNDYYRMIFDVLARGDGHTYQGAIPDSIGDLRNCFFEATADGICWTEAGGAHPVPADVSDYYPGGPQVNAGLLHQFVGDLGFAAANVMAYDDSHNKLGVLGVYPPGPTQIFAQWTPALGYNWCLAHIFVKVSNQFGAPLAPAIEWNAPPYADDATEMFTLPSVIAEEAPSGGLVADSINAGVFAQLPANAQFMANVRSILPGLQGPLPGNASPPWSVGHNAGIMVDWFGILHDWVNNDVVTLYPDGPTAPAAELIGPAVGNDFVVFDLSQVGRGFMPDNFTTLAGRYCEATIYAQLAGGGGGGSGMDHVSGTSAKYWFGKGLNGGDNSDGKGGDAVAVVPGGSTDYLLRSGITDTGAPSGIAISGLLGGNRQQAFLVAGDGSIPPAGETYFMFQNHYGNLYLYLDTTGTKMLAHWRSLGNSWIACYIMLRFSPLYTAG
jgi:hypothetical protein